MKNTYPVPYEGRVYSDHENTLHIRRGKAAEHELAMVAKYSARLSDFEIDDYHNWQEQIVRVGDDGQSIRYTHKDYPLPHSERYFRRFVELFLSKSAGNCFPDTLGQQFVGDKVDADYIGTLFIMAAEAGLFIEGAALVFLRDQDYYWYRPAGPGECQPLSGIPSCNVFFGGKINEMRKDAIKGWLDRRAGEINQVYTPLSSIPKAKDMEPEVSITTGGGSKNDPRENISLDEFLVTSYLKTSASKDWTMPSGRPKPTLDDLAAKVQFYPKGHPIKYRDCTHKPARVSALVEGLDKFNLIGAAGPDALVGGIVARYGQVLKKSKRPEYDANPTYLKFYDLVESLLKEWKINRLI